MSEEIIQEAIPAADATEATPAPESEATPTESADPWDIKFEKEEPAESVDIPPAAEATVSEESKEGQDIGEETAEIPTDPEEPLNPETLDGEVPPLSRSQLRDFESKFLTPFRNPQTSIDSAIDALQAYQPERFREMAQGIVDKSLSANPDAWVQAATRIKGLTVEQVKSWHTAPPASENTQPATEPLDNAIKTLTDLYGENWRDPSKDAEMYDDDRNLAVLARNLIAAKEASSSKDSEAVARAEKLEKELEALKPQIEEIRAAEITSFENSSKELYQKQTGEYRSAIETKALAKIVADNGFAPSEQDTDVVKNTKEAMVAKFKSDGVSEFDSFLSSKYTKSEALGKAINRVDSLMSTAAAKATAAEKGVVPVQDGDKVSLKRLSPTEIATMKRDSEALSAQAKEEQDALTVMYLHAAKEFLTTPTVTAPMDLLQENAMLRRQLGLQGQRQEITGSASAPAKSTVEKMKESGDPWGSVLTEGLVQAAR